LLTYNLEKEEKKKKKKKKKKKRKSNSTIENVLAYKNKESESKCNRNCIYLISCHDCGNKNTGQNRWSFYEIYNKYFLAYK